MKYILMPKNKAQEIAQKYGFVVHEEFHPNNVFQETARGVVVEASPAPYIKPEMLKEILATGGAPVYGAAGSISASVEAKRER